MFNVLPPEEKDALAKEYKIRRFVVIAFLFVITLAIGLILLFPSYLTSQINNQSISEALRMLSEELKKGSQHVATPGDTAALREKITILNASKDTTSVYLLLSTVIQAKTAGIKIGEFSFKKGSDGTGDILTVNGNARTRDSLTQFARNLEAETEFSAVDLPISNLAKDKDIDFTMTISVRAK